MPLTLVLATALVAQSHYSVPPCAADEVEVSLTAPELGRTRYGILCSSNCTTATCPSDVPDGVTATPTCSLAGSSASEKFCGLECEKDSDCGGGGAKCLGIVPGLIDKGTCAYSPQISLRADPRFCLDLAGDIMDNGSTIWLWPCGNGTYPGQQWAFGYGGNNTLALTTSTGSKKCLDLTNGNQSNWNPLELWDCVGNINQHWSYNKETGQISLIASGNKKCIDVRDGKFAPGTIVQLYDCSDWPQQQWDVAGATMMGGRSSQHGRTAAPRVSAKSPSARAAAAKPLPSPSTSKGAATAQ